MTTPQPTPDPTPNGGGNPVTNAWENFRTAPRWVWVAVVVVGGLAAWWFIHQTQSSGDTTVTDDTQTWRQKATDLLISRGYQQGQVQTAMSHYFDGGQMSAQDTALIQAAIMSIGLPGIPGQSPDYQTSNPVTDPGPGAPSASNASSSTGGVGNSGTPDLQNVTTYGDDGSPDPPAGNWKVVSMGYGWTSTLRGIATNMYGNASLGTTLLAYNSGLVASDWQQIPAGKTVTVPRQLQN
jgi:hypothetical protein